MKEAGILVLQVLGALCLIAIAALLLVVLIPVAFLWKIFVSIFYDKRKARDILTGTARFFLALAISLDKFGNVAYGGLFNNLLLKDKLYEFGDTSETVSEVLGWGYRYGDLTKNGLFLRRFVNKVDFTETDHCEAARLSAIKKAEKKIEDNKIFQIRMRTIKRQRDEQEFLEY